MKNRYLIWVLLCFPGGALASHDGTIHPHDHEAVKVTQPVADSAGRESLPKGKTTKSRGEAAQVDKPQKKKQPK